MSENLDKVLLDEDKNKDSEKNSDNNNEKKLAALQAEKLNLTKSKFYQLESELKKPGYESSFKEAIKQYERVKDELETGSIEEKIDLFNYIINFYEFLINYPIRNQ